MVDAASTATITDYTFTPITLTFLPSSSTSQTFTVTILNNIIPKPNESLVLKLSGATNGARFVDSVHTITIVNS